MIAKKQWFEWEREATVHPILICLEAWMEPTKKYCGKAWPSTYLHYQGDIVFWINQIDELYDYGKYLFDKYSVADERKKLEGDIIVIAKKLDIIFQKYEKTNLKLLPVAELLDLYILLKNGFVEWFTPGALVEPIGLEGEKRIRALLETKGTPKKETENIISIITTSQRKTFSRFELEDLLSIANKAHEGGNIESALIAHAKKYFWLHNNYFTTEVLTKDFFKDELNLILSKHPDPSNYLNKLNSESASIVKRKKEILMQLNLSRQELEMIDFLELFVWYNDYRKEYVMKILHYLDLVLAEIGKRRGLTLTQMKYSLPLEIPAIVNGEFDSSVLEKRMQEFTVHYDLMQNIFQHFTNNAAEAWKKIKPNIRHEQEHIELNGLPASRGTVTGKAYVTMSASEAKNIKKGEILVTSMTTPDFVTSMKKAAAVVTNEGGILCHAAIVCRELGIPCVVGTMIATKAIKTGDNIEVNADQGIVKKI